MMMNWEVVQVQDDPAEFSTLVGEVRNLLKDDDLNQFFRGDLLRFTTTKSPMNRSSQWIGMGTVPLLLILIVPDDGRRLTQMTMTCVFATDEKVRMGEGFEFPPGSLDS